MTNPACELQPLAPPLKWAGGKRWLLPRLRELWTSHEARRLVEPFCGGLSVALGLMPQSALLNDANPHLVNFYAQVQRGLTLDIALHNDAATFAAHRARFNVLIGAGEANTNEAAQLFYYLNRTGFNGLCRFNRAGGFNVPFGQHKSINYARDFTALRAVLSRWELACGDFAVLPTRADDFLYADPPYDGTFAGYAAAGFNWNDQTRLAQWLSGQRGPVVVSNAATPRVIELYRAAGFTLEVRDAPRRIACNGNRATASEMLAWKNL